MSDNKPKPPDFVFVDNTADRMVAMRRALPARAGETPVIESTVLGRGLNWVRAEYVDAAALAMFGGAVVDPTKIPDALVGAAVQRCTSRQALIEWRRSEKRPGALALLRARLDKPAVASDENEAELN